MVKIAKITKKYIYIQDKGFRLMVTENKTEGFTSIVIGNHLGQSQEQRVPYSTNKSDYQKVMRKLGKMSGIKKVDFSKIAYNIEAEVNSSIIGNQVIPFLVSAQANNGVLIQSNYQKIYMMTPITNMKEIKEYILDFCRKSLGA